MLRRVAFADLPRAPRSVRVLHHTSGGVVIAAVAYDPTPTLTPTSPSPPPPPGPLFFSVVEMPAPNERGLPLRVVHVRVPQPSTAVNSLTLLRSADGEDVYLVVQAVEAVPTPPQTQFGVSPKSVTTYVYRRQVVKVEAAGADADRDGDAEGEWSQAENGNVEGADLVSSPVSAGAAGSGQGNGTAHTAGVRIRYQRLPRTVADADGPLWTAATAFSAAETPIFGASAQAAAPAAGTGSVALVTASAAVAASSSANQLQLWCLTGTRLALAATYQIPALSGFPISQILTVPGTQDAVLLRCHNSVVEVDVAALRSGCAHYPHIVTTNALLTRAWRLSPHDRLTSCDTKDALLYAGTEAGDVVAWDLRTPTSSAANAQPLTSRSIGVPITGLYAPYATGFITCDASGGVRDWVERGDMAEEDMHEGTNDGAAASSQFPYCSRVPVESPNGLEGCVAMEGHDNFAAVVTEGGRLSLYFCS
ncbi:hypothetical protein ABB37_06343 [Leptomonas pyrrhocoris]|uniref:Guanine nucleotide-binding protein subunit beta-like protein n=1 Tax=Leptomonas pyrrhocoris TaxID=157538 RepID=A0A0N1J4M3_LEPPY|nr:hypothetical protein ABB37_06343 [Leptomonas pyrrhocoris]KPA78171.1 hypothetical protein ABB37_06343 [Leptomonas pyrrhocoris]|eukprot:XP_015656610.1 hypothetical protein ABB37_06343 [Leptomonas pyrrhocoris]